MLCCVTIDPTLCGGSLEGKKTRQVFFSLTDSDAFPSTYLLSGAKAQPVIPKNGLYLTLEDVQANAVLGYNIHSCPTRVISLENTLNGVIMPLDEVRRISSFAREHGIRMHCDGARLWEVVSAGAGTLPQFCELFDTVTMCFSKGLCAPVGSVIVGSEDTIKHCRWMRTAIGGALHKPGLLTAAARVAVDETFGTKSDGSESRLKKTHQLAKEIEALWIGKRGRMLLPVDTNMCWLDLDGAGCSDSRFDEIGKSAGLKLDGSRLVVHYQIFQNRDEVLRRLEVVFSQVLSASERENTETKPGRTSKYQV